MLLHVIDANLSTGTRVAISAVRAVSPRAPVDILKTFMYRSDLFGKPFCAFAHAIMRGKSGWSEGEREFLGSFVSGLNQCTHCATAHAEVASLILGRDYVRDILQVDTALDRHPKLYAFLDFARRLTLTPKEIDYRDIARLKTASLGEAEILDGMLIVAGFNFINRLASALHFEPPRASDFLPSAWFLRIFGYRFLGGVPKSSKRGFAVIEVTHSSRNNAADRVELVGSTRKWLEKLSGLDVDTIRRTPDLAKEMIDKVTYQPATVTQSDVDNLKSFGSTEEEIFNLILAAAATAGLLRLELALYAMRSQHSLEARLASPSDASQKLSFD